MLIIDNVCYQRPRDAEDIGNSAMRLHAFHRSNFFNILIRYFTATMGFATCPLRPTFIDHILSIFLGSPQKEVVRIHTKSIIAPVADKNPFRYWTLVKHIGEAVTSYLFPIDPKPPIPSIFYPIPYPAIIGFNDSTKESLFNRHISGRVYWVFAGCSSVVFYAKTFSQNIITTYRASCLSLVSLLTMCIILCVINFVVTLFAVIFTVNIKNFAFNAFHRFLQNICHCGEALMIPQGVVKNV